MAAACCAPLASVSANSAPAAADLTALACARRARAAMAPPRAAWAAPTAPDVAWMGNPPRGGGVAAISSADTFPQCAASTCSPSSLT